MHHQGRYLQTVEQIDAAGLGEDGQDLPLHAFRVEGAVVGPGRLLHQLPAFVTDFGTAERGQQVGLLLDSHVPARRLAPRQQLQQRRARRRQTLCAGAGHHQGQAEHPLRCHIGQVLGDHAAHAGAEHMDPLDAEGVQQVQRITRHVPQAVGRRHR
ncbi:hypothetical protein D9M68_762510 [compost metagenome]